MKNKLLRPLNIESAVFECSMYSVAAGILAMGSIDYFLADKPIGGLTTLIVGASAAYKAYQNAHIINTNYKIVYKTKNSPKPE
jgi:hypothetical protein